jgi:hypothetical protein
MSQLRELIIEMIESNLITEDKGNLSFLSNTLMKGLAGSTYNGFVGKNSPVHKMPFPEDGLTATSFNAELKKFAAANPDSPYIFIAVDRGEMAKTVYFKEPGRTKKWGIAWVDIGSRKKEYFARQDATHRDNNVSTDDIVRMINSIKSSVTLFGSDPARRELAYARIKNKSYSDKHFDAHGLQTGKQGEYKVKGSVLNKILSGRTSASSANQKDKLNDLVSKLTDAFDSGKSYDFDTIAKEIQSLGSNVRYIGWDAHFRPDEVYTVSDLKRALRTLKAKG